MNRLLLLCLLALSACDSITKIDDSGTAGGGDADTDSDADSDSDSDADADADADTDADSDADSHIDVDCDQELTPAAVSGPDCVTDTISCGDSFVGTTQGGSSQLDGSEYVAWYCAVVGAESYTGPERVYAFEHPGTGDVKFYLDSPCSDLDLFVIRWEDDSTCPIEGYSILECEGDVSGGGAEITVWNNVVSRYLVAVDGPSAEEDLFGLTVECE